MLKGISFKESDFKAGGMDEFRNFYTANRSRVYRGKEGVQFPILYDNDAVRQGLAPILAYLHAGGELDGYFQRTEPPDGWMDGLFVSEGKPELADNFLEVLELLKQKFFKLQLYTDGRNASLLDRCLEKGLGDRVIMEIKAPVSLYSRVLGCEIIPEDVVKTASLAAQFPDFLFRTTIRPVVRNDDDPPDIDYLTPEEIGEIARLLEQSTGSKKQPYVLSTFDPTSCTDDRLKQVSPLPASALFKYRTAARRFQVLTEIEK
jgi:pyruvate formate lyase activating enzyme